MTPATERSLILLLVLLAAGLRLWNLAGSPIDHFDEGVYASNFWFDASENYRYPDRHLYAPPLLPALIEWAHVLFGPGVLACVGVNVVTGVGSVWLMWLFGRRVAGPLAGLAAATAWAFNDLAILYSRTAMTESLLCLFMLAAVLLAERGLSRLPQNSLSPAEWLQLIGGSGLLAGLAWLTKYNGWLTLAIIVSASAAWLVLSRGSRAGLIRVLGALGLIVGIASLCWGWYVTTLAPLGGYAAVAANHARYFVGLGGWGSSLIAQLQNAWLLSTWATACGVGLSLLFALPEKAEAANVTDDSSATRTDAASEVWSTGNLGLWLIASWWLGLSVAIPLYTPYPRLLLPWMMASCLLLGVFVAAENTGLPERIRALSRNRWFDLRLISAILIGSVLIPIVLQQGAWQTRDGAFRTALAIVQSTDERVRRSGRPAAQVVFYTYGEPALFYHLSSLGRLAGPIGHLEFARDADRPGQVPTFLVVGPHAQKSPLFAEQWGDWEDHFELVETFTYQPSLFVRLNESRDMDQTAEIRLYELKSPR